jgi:hypothetical protein
VLAGACAGTSRRPVGLEQAMRTVKLQRIAAAYALVAGVLLAAPAHADVYTWTDATGRVNVSNLPPPRNAREVQVVKPDPEAKARIEAAQRASREAAARKAQAERDAAQQAEVQALKARVADLERGVLQARAAPQVVLAAPPPAPVIVNMTPPLADDIAPLPLWNCAWIGCGWPAVVSALPAFPVLREPPRRKVVADKAP